MIAAVLIVLSLTWWSYRLIFRRVRSPQVTALTRISPQDLNPVANEPDSPSRHASDWTALDDLQLTRLLMASAPCTSPAVDLIDDAVPGVGREDIR